MQDNISIDNVEQEIKRKDLKFKKNVLQDKAFYNIISYQFFKSSEYIKNDNTTSQVLIAGDIYGHLKSENTEILNYKETVELIKNSHFNEKYIAFEGNSCIAEITDEKIILQNDLEGYRKLYYFKNNAVFCVSTDLSLLLSAIKKKWILRKNAVLSFLCSRESKWPLTFIEDVFVLSPLSRAEVTNNNIEITSKTLSDFYNLEKLSKEEVRQQLYEKYKLIVKRKKSDNTAVTLSGGYDSNCLVKLFTDVYGKNFTAVSVGYKAINERGTNINDETIYAERIANKLGIPFKKYIFDKHDFFNELDDFINAIDQPGHDPSSNFIMNKYLKSDGFDLVVNGMGGDANFSNKRNLILGVKLFYLSQYIGMNTISFVGKLMKYRGPFSYFKPYSKLDQAKTFYDLFERSQIFRSPICKYINSDKQLDIDNEKSLRTQYFKELFDSAKTNQEITYSLAVLTSPGSFHALSTAERNNIEILMPFINTKAILGTINGSQFNKITNRKFETSIFGDIDEELLAKSKSGFSIPYAEWMPDLADEVFEYYNNLKYFSKNDFDIQSFQSNYKNNKSFAESNHANIVIWKLLVVKKFIKKHSLNLH